MASIRKAKLITAEATAKIMIALEESIKLQSHYAGLLNMYDGGKRLQFADADEWIKRLAERDKG